MKTSKLDSRLIVLSPNDNVAVAISNIEIGNSIKIDDKTVTVGDSIPLGFKLAIRDIKRGEKIVKWGAPIGSATSDIAIGEIVHTHNMKSDYLPTYTLDSKETYAK
jgi:altronate dehydratase small subunit